MDRLARLLVVALLVGAFVSVPSAAFAADDCSTQELQTGTCTATVDPEKVTLGLDVTTPPGPDVPPDPSVSPGSGGGSPRVGPEQWVCDRLTIWDPDLCIGDRDIAADPITLSDIAAFRPDPGG